MGMSYARMGLKIFLIGLGVVIANRTLHKFTASLDKSLPF